MTTPPTPDRHPYRPLAHAGQWTSDTCATCGKRQDDALHSPASAAPAIHAMTTHLADLVCPETGLVQLAVPVYLASEVEARLAEADEKISRFDALPADVERLEAEVEHVRAHYEAALLNWNAMLVERDTLTVRAERTARERDEARALLVTVAHLVEQWRAEGPRCDTCWCERADALAAVLTGSESQ